MTAPAPVPALPDTERRTAYSISAQTGPFAVNFAIYGDSTDYYDWVEVWLNGVQQPSGNFGLFSPSGDISLLPRPITDAMISLVTASTGTLQIVGARRPRRTSQFAENRGVPARDFNQAFSDTVAQNRENWDLIHSRMFSVPAGETVTDIPPLSARANKLFGFDGGGNPLMQTIVPVGGMSVIQMTITRAQIPTVTLGTITLMVSGYAAAGDLGAGAIYTAVGAGSGSTGAIQDLAGTWFRLVISEAINLGWFGAVGDGIADDAPALRAAWAACRNGGEIYVPGTPSGYLMNSVVSNAVLPITDNKTSSIRGSGWSIKSGGAYTTPQGSVFKLGTNITTSIDFIHWTGTDLVSGVQFRNICICPFDNFYGLNRGRDGIFIDATTPNDNFYLTQCTIDNCAITTSRYSIHTNASAGTNNGGGGFAFSNVSNNQLMCINLTLVGDGIKIESNTIGQNLGTGGGPGIYASQITGGAGLFIFKNVIDTFNGMIVIDAATCPVIAYNELEMSVGFANTYGKLIDLRGTSSGVFNPIVVGNSISQNSAVGNYISINIDTTICAMVHDNRLDGINVGVLPINITANSSGAQIGPNALYYGGLRQLTPLIFTNASATTNNNIQPALNFTVANLPAGILGRTVFCTNARVFNGAGTLEGAGAGTGGLVSYNGTAWKIVGTNVTAIA